MLNIIKHTSALKISLIYFIISSAYILFSDYAVLNLLDGNISPEWLSAVQSYKGLAFVFITSVLLFYLIHREIKKQHQSEQKIKESEEKFSSLFKLNPTAIVFTRFSDGTIIEVNDAYCNLFGYSKETLLNQSTTKISLWKNSADRQQMMQKLQKNKYVHGFEAKAVHKSGKIIDTLSYLQIVEITGEKAIIGILLDVTEKNKKDRELKESRALLEKTINSLNEAVLVIDPDGRYIRLANKAVKQIFGYEPNELIGEQTDLLHLNIDQLINMAK